ncbi:MAG: hypothetical protein NUW37_17890 [Planctomycetes bacterium]|nr:hypothetical protein [Planctomycetota bacterium]MCR4318219.1 hypothetical protein [Planctomycetota bacterium]
MRLPPVHKNLGSKSLVSIGVLLVLIGVALYFYSSKSQKLPSLTFDVPDGLEIEYLMTRVAQDMGGFGALRGEMGSQLPSSKKKVFLSRAGNLHKLRFFVDASMDGIEISGGPELKLDYSYEWTPENGLMVSDEDYDSLTRRFASEQWFLEMCTRLPKEDRLLDKIGKSWELICDFPHVGNSDPWTPKGKIVWTYESASEVDERKFHRFSMVAQLSGEGGTIGESDYWRQIVTGTGEAVFDDRIGAFEKVSLIFDHMKERSTGMPPTIHFKETFELVRVNNYSGRSD